MLTHPSNKEKISDKATQDKVYCDTIIALEYIIKNLEEHSLQHLADALKDIVHIHTNIQQHQKLNETYSIEEYGNLLYLFLIQKYFEKLSLDNYKQKAIHFTNNHSSEQ